MSSGALESSLVSPDILKNIFDHHAIISVTDISGRILYANDKFCEISGYRRDELVGSNHRIIKSDAHSPNFFREMWRTISQGETWQGQIQNRCKDGSAYWVQTTIMPVFDNDGQLEKYVSIRTDVTRQLKSQRALGEFKQVLDQTLDSIFIFDSEALVFSYVNLGATEQLGYTEPELLKMTPVDITPEIDEQQFRIMLLPLLNDNVDSLTFETVYQQKSTQQVPVEIFLQYFPETSATGQFIAIVRDVSERKRASRQLYETLERISDGFFSLDDQWRFTYLNPAAAEIFGTSWYDLKGQCIWTVMPEVADYFKPHLHRAMREQRRIWIDEFKPGDRWLEMYVYPSPEGVSVYMQDMTEYKRLKQEHRRMQEQVRQAQKMDAIGQLTAGIAHDFNNILATIMGYTDLAMVRCVGEDQDQEKLQEYLGRVYKAGERARDLIQQMMAYSRPAEMDVVVLDPRSLIKETVKMLHSLLPASIRLSFDYPPDESVKINIEPVQLQQMVMNLCINARDAMQGKGVLALRLELIPHAQGECVSCHGTLDGEYVALSVQDSGHGMTPDIQERLFEPFFTTKDVGEGTGLGLPVIHGIMHAHRGHIQLESEPGCGATFYLLFPQVESEGEVPVEQNRQAPFEPVEKQAADLPMRPVIAGRRLLVVDDELPLLSFLQEWLQGQGFEVHAFQHSAEALAYFEEDPQAIDLLITDQTMPGLSGLELIRKVRLMSPGMPSILCSGYLGSIDDEELEALEKYYFAKKPFDHAQLLAAINRLLGVEAEG